jgi:glutamine synthetase
MLSDILAQVEQGLPKRTLRGGTIDLGARTLPLLPRHSGDRNRTSPFAFTGNKFEFRAVGSSASIAWPNTVLNTIVAESLDFIASELEKSVGGKASPAKLQEAVLKVLKKEIKEHKKVIFDGDNYSSDWHKEAAKRGLPIMGDSVAAYPILKSKKTVDLFKAYGVLNKAEVDSRFHIAVEKYVKQMGIEADTAVSIAKTMIVPAVLQQQELQASSLAALEAAGLKAADQKKSLEEFVGLITSLKKAITRLEKVGAAHHDDPYKHAQQIKSEVKPAMADLREIVDTLETQVNAEFWPLPTYQEMLFLN